MERLQIKDIQKRQHETVLIMQGGGSLGAYECGVYKTLEKHGIELDIVAGTSIGAVNAAIIVGSKRNSPAQDLEHFWLTLADNITPSFLPNNIRSIYASMFAAIYGNSNAFEPIWFSFPYLIYDYSSSTSSSYAIPHLYDTIPLKKTLSEFVDFDKINNYEYNNNMSNKDVGRRRTPRLIVTSTDIQRSESVTFDSKYMKIDADHIIACAGFPFYGIAWTYKDGKYLWDGSLLSNTPLREVIDASPKYDKRVYIVNLFPPNVRNLLFKLADKDYSAQELAFAVADNFDKLPPNVRNLLFKLAENEYAAHTVVYAVDVNFDKLSIDVRNELLVKLVDNKDAAEYVAYTVSSKFDKLPENMRNELLLKLAENEYQIEELAYAVADYDNADVAESMCGAIDNNFDKLPENTRNELLLKLAENVRNELLFTPAENEDAAKALAYVVSSNFEKLPENMRNELLVKLAISKYASYNVGKIVFNNFNQMPKNIREEVLLKLTDNKDAAESVAYTIANNFDKLPENVQNLLFRLADDQNAAIEVANFVANNFDKLQENVRNVLLLKVVDYKHAAYYGDRNFDAVANFVANNFDKLPENVRNELAKIFAKHGYDIDE